MAGDKSEEFKKFILENREIIEDILKEDKKKKVDEAKTKTKDLSDAMMQVFSDDDVQKHFITGCLEFLHFIEAVICAAPLSPEVREAVDKLEEAKAKTVRNVVSVGAKDRMEKINIDDSKKPKTSTKSSTKSKPQNIKINTKKS